MDQPPLPTILAEVEALILRLYEPRRTPTEVVSIQEILQRLQKTPQGWQLAQNLLDRPRKDHADDRLSFFGALTIVIKLNTENSALSEGDAKELLQNLLRWLIAANKDGANLTTNKLCHALVTYFVHYSHLWPDCVRHVLLCLHVGRSLAPGELCNAADTAQVASSMGERTLRPVILLINNLIDDVSRTDMNSAKYMDTHKRLVENISDVIALYRVGLSGDLAATSAAEPLDEEVLRGLQSWILYAQRTSFRPDVLINPLRTLVGRVIESLSNEYLYAPASNLLIDILSNYSSFFLESHYDSIATVFEQDWAQERYSQIVGGDFDFEISEFAHLMIAYGDARVQNLMQSTEERSRRILAGLCGLLTATGYPVAEDTIFVPALEFWSTFVEIMTDNLYSDEDGTQAWAQAAISLVMQVVENCWKKIQYPPIETFMSWESDVRVGFGDARKDVADLLQSLYALSGRSLVSLFVDLLLRSVSTKAWAELEATAFCLAALSDCISDETVCDDLLSRVFSSPLFDLLALGEAHLPVRLRQTALSLIERYSEYFERHAEYLPAALNLLFDAVGSAAVSGPSSKSILSLCSSCRSLLTSEVSTFLGHFQNLHANPDIDSLVEERIVAAISSIIEAIKDEEHRLQVFQQLFSFIRNDVAQCLQMRSGEVPGNLPLFAKGLRQSLKEGQNSSNIDDVLEQLVLLSLRCLASMAKGMQATSEVVDLEGGARATPKSEQLIQLQNEIMAIMARVQSAFPSSGEAVEAICNIFKAGFSETEPGPFVFPPATIADFFTQQNHQTPRIGMIISTACSFISSVSNGSSSQTVQILAKLLPWVVALLQALPEPEADTELAQNGIEFVHRLMNKHPEVLLQLQPTSSLEFFFLFTLNVLNGREPLPKQAAADFWTGFITLTPLDLPLRESVNQAMEHLGPLISQSLIQNIGGNASRSELDKLSEPLKKLVVQQVRARSWLEHALADASFPSPRVSPEDKSTFLKKIISLRGARQTNTIVKDFWLACRGSNFSYAS